ncbi:hypothetical protein [Paenibacillus sacheonensis]|uniref:hypothetical protein n=1 Tax=Paenibacillus sacheonensis TaxID=742054 RepID=UPI001EF8244E|nr:hypothetical protein [Paenibacillus sacheonensis]MBM7563920.1 hypothetical protein [Paenibacillus sacheonensis]
MIRSLPAVGVVLESTPLPADVVRLPVRLESVDIPVGILLPKTADYMPMSLDLLLQCLQDGVHARLAGSSSDASLS